MLHRPDQWETSREDMFSYAHVEEARHAYDQAKEAASCLRRGAFGLTMSALLLTCALCASLRVLHSCAPVLLAGVVCISAAFLLSCGTAFSQPIGILRLPDPKDLFSCSEEGMLEALLAYRDGRHELDIAACHWKRRIRSAVFFLGAGLTLAVFSFLAPGR